MYCNFTLKLGLLLQMGFFTTTFGCFSDLWKPRDILVKRPRKLGIFFAGFLGFFDYFSSLWAKVLFLADFHTRFSLEGHCG